ncbi:MAG: hypothetical protein O8C63_06460 [Candidatus Methanoperedens sp.]|nr:hypothetical protein [Candidatus Methanoperedens sp.]
MKDNNTNEFKAKKEKLDGGCSSPHIAKELKKSDLPGVVETASLGKIKKPNQSK